jgi:hypothetical protein
MIDMEKKGRVKSDPQELFTSVVTTLRKKGKHPERQREETA